MGVDADGITEQIKECLIKLIMSGKFAHKEIAELVKISEGDSNVADKAIKYLKNFSGMYGYEIVEFAKISGGNWKVCMEAIYLCKGRLKTEEIVELLKISEGNFNVCVAVCHFLGISL